MGWREKSADGAEGGEGRNGRTKMDEKLWSVNSNLMRFSELLDNGVGQGGDIDSISNGSSHLMIFFSKCYPDL